MVECLPEMMKIPSGPVLYYPEGRQRDIGADVNTEPRVGPLRRRHPPRVGRVQPGAPRHALQHVVEEDRVRFDQLRKQSPDRRR
jgi:hypothetical protein